MSPLTGLGNLFWVGFLQRCHADGAGIGIQERGVVLADGGCVGDQPQHVSQSGGLTKGHALRLVLCGHSRSPGSGRGGEGFFEDGLEEVGGVGARVRDFPSQRADAALQRRHARHTAR